MLDSGIYWEYPTVILLVMQFIVTQKNLNIFYYPDPWEDKKSFPIITSPYKIKLVFLSIEQLLTTQITKGHDHQSWRKLGSEFQINDKTF